MKKTNAKPEPKKRRTSQGAARMKPEAHRIETPSVPHEDPEDVLLWDFREALTTDVEGEDQDPVHHQETDKPVTDDEMTPAR